MPTTSRNDLGFSFLEDLPVTRAAAEFARQRHGPQRRDSDGALFIVHPLEVASELQRCGYSDHVIAAAVLHDVLENTGTTPTDLQARFGSEICKLVALVSDDPAINNDEAQKDDTRDRVRAAGGDALVIYAADKISKVRELRVLAARGLPQPDAKTKLNRHQKSLHMLEQTVPDSRLIQLLRFELDALQQLPPEPKQD